MEIHAQLSERLQNPAWHDSRLLNSIRSRLPDDQRTVEQVLAGNQTNIDLFTQTEFDLCLALSMQHVNKPRDRYRGYYHKSSYNKDNYQDIVPRDNKGRSFWDNIRLKLNDQVTVTSLDLGAGFGWSIYESVKEFNSEFLQGQYAPYAVDHILPSEDEFKESGYKSYANLPNDYYTTVLPRYLHGDVRYLDQILKNTAIYGLDVVFSSQCLYQIPLLTRISVIEQVYNNLNIGGIAHLHTSHDSWDPLVKAIPDIRRYGYDFQDVDLLLHPDSRYLGQLVFTRNSPTPLSLKMVLIHDSKFMKDVSFTRKNIRQGYDPIDQYWRLTASIMHVAVLPAKS